MAWARWRFESGLGIPVAFEIVEGCSQDVVFGEDIIHGHDLYITHAASITASYDENALWGLAAFSFVNKWQKKLQDMSFFRKGASKFVQNTLPQLLRQQHLMQRSKRCRSWAEES